MAATVYAVCNQKGGCAKTVTSVSFGIGLAREGKKVLLIDMDAQGSMTASLGYQQPDRLEVTLADILGGILLERHPHDRERLDGFVELMAEICCSTRKTIRVNQEDMCTEVVKSRFLKLDSSHIEYVMDCLDKNTALVGNIRAYTLSALFNAPVTISQYYSSLVSHDMAHVKEQRIWQKLKTSNNPTVSSESWGIPLTPSRCISAKTLIKPLRTECKR